MNITKSSCYEKSLEGLASFATNMYFKIEPILYFEDNYYYRKEIRDNNNKYEHYLEDTKIYFIPKITSFYNKEECLIKVFIPQTKMFIEGKYVNYGTSLCFSINALEETFINITVSKKELNEMSLDFNEIKIKIDKEINKYCHNQFKKMIIGINDVKNEWNIRANYSNVELKTIYTI